MISEKTPTSCKVSWLKPEKHHSCLKGFVIKVCSPNGPIIFEQSVLSWIKEYTITGLNQCQDYEVEILAHCSAGIYKTESEMQANEKKLKFLTPPEKVCNFKLENSTSNSLTVKWDVSSSVNSINLKVGPFGFLPKFQCTTVRRKLRLSANISTNGSTAMLTDALYCYWLKGM